MGYKIQFKASVLDDLHSIGQLKGERILREIYQKLAADPKRGDILKSAKMQLWQHHVGNAIVIYSFTDDIILILFITEVF